MQTDYKRWLEKAKRHLSTAHLNHDNKGFDDTTCYFTHQTAELALKAFLMAKNTDFPKVHALPQLLSLCMTIDPDFSHNMDDMAFLNGFYIEAKYPLDIAIEPSPKDVQRALSCASQIVDFVEKKLQCPRQRLGFR